MNWLPADKRLEEGYTLDVVPVEVGEKKRRLNRLVAKFALQAFAQPAHPTSAIEDDQRAIGQADFQATGIAPVAGIARLRSWRGASYAPKIESAFSTAPRQENKFCSGLGKISRGEYATFGFKY